MADDNKLRGDDGGLVGYGRPPKASQFKKGQSGNLGGRPRKDRSLHSIAVRVLTQRQRLANQPHGARRWFSMLELAVMTLKQLAASGNQRASALFTKISDRHARAASPQREIGYLVVPETLSEEEWEALYSPKDDPPGEPDDAG